MTPVRTWTLCGALAVAAVLAAGWFLLVGPTRADAAALREQAATQDGANAALTVRLRQLQDQAERVPAQQEELATLGRQLPAEPELPAVIRELTAAAERSGVTLSSLTPTAPVALTATSPVPAAAPAPAATPAPAAAPAPAATPAPATAAAATAGQPAVAPAGAPQVMEVAIALEVVGEYSGLQRLLDELESMERVFLVSGFSLAPAEGGAGKGVSPELTLTVNGRVFTAPVPATPAGAPVAGAAPAVAAPATGAPSVAAPAGAAPVPQPAGTTPPPAAN